MAFKAPPHCPRLQGLLASRVKNNVGLGLCPSKEVALRAVKRDGIGGFHSMRVWRSDAAIASSDWISS